MAMCENWIFDLVYILWVDTGDGVFGTPEPFRSVCCISVDFGKLSIDFEKSESHPQEPNPTATHMQ